MMMSVKRSMAVLAVAALVLGLGALAYASGGGGGEHAEDGSLLKGFLFQLVNFGALVAILVLAGGKPIKGFFRERTETISKGIEEARAAREEAEKALAEVQAKLDGKDTEIEKMVSAARDAGEKEREHLIKEGERMSARILEQARAGIDFELKQAKEGLKAEAADYALKLAEEKIGHRLSDDEQIRLMEDAIKRLEASS
jgi:F-type H+-transporting ATPase subunit b